MSCCFDYRKIKIEFLYEGTKKAGIRPGGNNKDTIMHNEWDMRSNGNLASEMLSRFKYF